MSKVYRVFEVKDNVPQEGCRVQKHALTDGRTIPAIVVGQSGRGRYLGVTPVMLLPGSASAEGDRRIQAASIVRQGRVVRLAEADPAQATDEACIAIFRTGIGFRGWNQHSGDVVPSATAGAKPKILPLPGEVLSVGGIAEGDAGRMGSGEQIVLLMPQGQIVSVYIGGRVYGRPREWFYRFDGASIQYTTAEDRVLLGWPVTVS